MKNSISKKNYSGAIVVVFFLFLLFCKPVFVYADTTVEWDVYGDESLVIDWDIYNAEYVGPIDWVNEGSKYFDYRVNNISGKEVTITTTSTNRDK